jgi:CRISPR/Cas system-associated exonuclease Cas4 (RecB family)
MKKQSKFMEIVEKATKFAEDHQREIMLGSAIAGTVFTAIASWKAGIKADKVMTEQKAKMEALEADYADEEIGMTEEEFKNRRKELTVETVKQMAPIVAPVAIAASGTIISVIAGYR